MVSLASLIPDDTEANIKWAPNANTRRVYDRNVYSNDTAFTTPPVVNMVGLPARVNVDQTTIYAKPQNAVMLDPTGTDATKAGIWYTDVIVAADPDIEPNFIYCTLTHPSWLAPETRLVPAGTTKLCWSELAIAEPPDPIQVVFVSNPSGGTSGSAPVLVMGTVTETTGTPSVTIVPDSVPGKYIVNFVLKTGTAGANGKSAYQQAVDSGFSGTQAQWLTSLVGAQGKSAYQVAVDSGFGGNVTAWLASLVGAAGPTGPAPTVSATAVVGPIGASTVSLGNGAYRIDFSIPTASLDISDGSIPASAIGSFEQRSIAAIKSGPGISAIPSDDGLTVEISSTLAAQTIWGGNAEISGA